MHVNMTCSVCKQKTRSDGFCLKCRQKTGVADISIPKKNRKSWGEAREKEFEDYNKQLRWLEHKLSTAGSPQKKEKAKRQLEDWKRKKGDRYEYLNKIIKQMHEDD